ncbi:hypothetical protein NKDENANG_00108 [Candidatus Entotheonellaceae bacterium PAL068K]
MDPQILSLLGTIINIYIVLLFVRMFVTDSERYDAVIGMIFRATEPVTGPLGTALRTRRVDLAPLPVIVVLLLLKGMMMGSVPKALQGFADTLLQLYVLIIIIIVGFREYYINPIASFGQRIVNPIRAVAMNFSRQVTTVNLLSVLLLVVLHSFVTWMLLSFRADSMSSTVVKHSLELIVDLTGFFTIVIIFNALMSWISPDPLNPLVQLIKLISAPIVDPLRRVIPPLGGMIDISPIIAILALQVANHIGHRFLALLLQG